MKLPHLVPVVLATAVAGFFLGRSTAPHGISPTGNPGEVSGAVGSSSPSAPGDEKATVPDPADATAAAGPYTAEELKKQMLKLSSETLDNAAQARAWAEFYARLESSDIPALAAALAATNDDKLENGVRALYGAWAESDPSAAWNSALSFSKDGRCNDAMHAVLDTVGKRNPSAALAMAQALGNPGLREHMTSSALQALAKSDPSRAFETALRSAENGDTSAFYSVLSQWVREDPAGAQRAVAKLGGQLGDQARLAVVQGLVDKDPEAAWNYALSLPPSTERFSYWDPRTRVIESWSRSDPRKALDAAFTLDDQEIRNQAVAEAVDSWATADFSAALSYAGAINDPGLRGHVLAALARNRNADPSTMFDILLDQAPAGDTFRNALSNLMNRWAQSNPREAAAATLQLPAGEALNAAASRLAQEWASSAADKTEVLAWVSQLPQGRARNQALESVFENWSARDAAGAQRAWAALDAKDREEVFSAVTAGWSRTQPAEAARWAATQVDQPGGRDALRRALSSWTQSSPMEAASFVQSLPDAARSGLTSELIDRWYDTDPFAAAEWLKRQPAGPARDEGVSAIAMEISGENPETALAWTKSIVNAESRASQERNILQRWIRNDAAGASAWIRTAQLPPETKAELLGSSR